MKQLRNFFFLTWNSACICSHSVVSDALRPHGLWFSVMLTNRAMFSHLTACCLSDYLEKLDRQKKCCPCLFKREAYSVCSSNSKSPTANLGDQLDPKYSLRNNKNNTPDYYFSSISISTAPNLLIFFMFLRVKIP